MSATTARSRLRSTVLPAIVAVSIGLGALAVLFWPECQAAVRIWIASTAYGHCFLVIPMSLYLAWERRDALAGLTPRPTPLLALLAVPVSAVWLLAERVGIMEGRQLAVIGAVEVLFLAVLGWRLFRTMLAPLSFLIFLVPFGAFVTPWLQAITARIIAIGLRLTGIPNYITDFTIEIPEGTFYVAEACAGLRFLIAAVAFGVFYAFLNYRSPGRRVVFIAASVIVPIFANGLRALGIVVLGHIIGSAEAAAADHIIYGWVFFSIVMLLLVVAGMPLREAPAGVSARRLDRADARPPASALWVCCAVFVLAAAGPAVSGLLDRNMRPAELANLPALNVPAGCRIDDAPRAAEPSAPLSSAPLSTMAVQRLVCQDIAILVTAQAFPDRSKPDAITRERRRLTAELEADDAEVSTLPGTDASAGPWQMIRTFDPYRVTAVSTWIDGAPAQGGLRGRLQQARDSIMGGSHAPVLITASVALRGRIPAADQAQLQDALVRFVNAQPDLAARIAQASRVTP